MKTANRVRKTAILTLVIASFLFTAGAGQSLALDHATEGDFGGNLVVNLLERLGDFVSDLAVEVIEIFHKDEASPVMDG